MASKLTLIELLDPSAAPKRVCHRLTPEEDRPTCVWRFPLRELRQGPSGTRVLDRGAEDRQEGDEGGREEGQAVRSRDEWEMKGLRREREQFMGKAHCS